MKRFVSRLASVRRLTAAGLLTLLTVVVGCGQSQLVLGVDVLSFADTIRETPFSFPDVPTVPGGGTMPEQVLVDRDTINLVDGLSDAAVIQSVLLLLQTESRATTGTGDATIRVYLGDMGTDPRTTTPVFQQTLQFGATPDTAESTAEGAELARLFTQKQMLMSVTVSGHGPSTGPNLTGAQVSFTRLYAQVTATRKLQ